MPTTRRWVIKNMMLTKDEYEYYYWKYGSDFDGYYFY